VRFKWFYEGATEICCSFHFKLLYCTKKVMKKTFCTACDGTGSVNTHTKVIVCPQCEGSGIEKPFPKPKFKSKLKKE
jgi:DnaJ-class molecular chaperone